jgi:hypothetical protein
MFREKLPRMYELRDHIESPDSLNPFWKNLDVNLQNEGKRIKCLPYEDALQSLDETAWEFIKKEATIKLTKWDEKNARGQQQLFDILNQAMAYKYLLREIGCSNIRFIPRSSKIKTPDLEGILWHINVICEVKTINISENEAFTRREMSSGRPRCDQPPRKLDQAFWDKLWDTLVKAKKQIETYASGNGRRNIVYIFINFDDMWDTYREQYFQEIDDFLSSNIIQGIEIVFHNQRTVSNEIITMKNATVFNEPEYF